MSWIIYSFLMFSFSVAYYLILRKLQIEKIDNKINLLFLFMPATPLFITWMIIDDKNFAIKWEYMLIIFVATFFFSYLGNIWSAKGIQAAPNSGYSLIIQKSYAIYTAIASVFLFDSELSLRGLIAIIIILIFSGFIMLGGRTKNTKNELAWIVPSILSFLAFGSLVLTSKYLLTKGMDPITRTFYTNIFVSMMYALDLWKNSKKVDIKGFLSKKNLVILAIIMGVTNGLFNAFMQLGFNAAPNVGYVNVINTSSITAITLLSAIIYKDQLSMKKIIGMIGILVGIFLLLA